MTGREYIEFCLKARRLVVSSDEIDRLNSRFRLPLTRFASNYSMGMKKRLMLMTLMLQASDLYILDEPFNGLDLAGSILLTGWIRRLKAEGRLVILSSHIISSLTDVCDEISYMHAGRIVHQYAGESAREIEQDITERFLTENM